MGSFRRLYLFLRRYKIAAALQQLCQFLCNGAVVVNQQNLSHKPHLASFGEAIVKRKCHRNVRSAQKFEKLNDGHRDIRTAHTAMM